LKIRLYSILILFVLVISGLVIGLRGTLPQSGAVQLDALHSIASIQGTSRGNLIWADNFTGNMWQLSAPSSTVANLDANHLLSLSITFSKQDVVQAVSISRNVNFSLDENPIVIVGMSVSGGVHYGIRFTGTTPSGATFDAWREGSRLQHRPGLGTIENVTANLVAETYLANNQLPLPGSKITRLWFYVEATIGTSGDFSLQATSLQAFELKQTTTSSTEISGTFSGIVINLGLPSLSQSIFQAYASYDIRGTSDLRYTPFLVSGTSVLAQGYTYTQNAFTSHQVAVLLPQRVTGFPSILPNANFSSIIISADAGSITHFKIEDLTFKLTSTSDLGTGSVDSNTAQLFMASYLVFLFVTPVAAVILFVKVFKNEN